MNCFLNIPEDIECVWILRKNNHVVSLSLSWCNHNKLWIKGKAEIIITDGHLEISNFDQVNYCFRNWNRGDTFGMKFIGPWNNKIKSIIEKLSDSFVCVSSFKIS